MLSKAPTLVLALATAALAFGCKKRIEDPAPMETGSFLTYEVIEQAGNTTEKYNLTLRFTKSEDGYSVKVEGPKGTKTVALDLEGAPVEAPIVFDMVISGQMNMGLLYIPTKDRRGGVVSKAGRITKKKRYQDWQAWEVMYRESGVAGARYFDDTLGVLVGWNVDFGNKAVVSKLVGSG